MCVVLVCAQAAAAKLLTPDSIAQGILQEIMVALREICNAGVPLLLETKAALLTREVTERMESSTNMPAKVSSLVSACLPWVDRGSSPVLFQPLDRTTWSLQQLVDLPERDRLDWFTNTAFSSLLLPAVEAGEPQFGTVTQYCQAWLGAWEKCILYDLSDATMRLTERCLRCWRVLSLLSSFDVAVLDDELWNDLDYVCKLKGSQDTGVEVLLSLTLHDTNAYAKRMLRLLDSRPKMMKHMDQFSRDSQFIDNLPDCVSEEVALELTEICRRACQYSEDLSEELTSPFLDKLRGAVKGAMHDAIRLTGEGAVNAMAWVETLVPEATLAFPLCNEINDMANQSRAMAQTTLANACEQRALAICSNISATESGELISDTVIDELKHFIKTTPAMRVQPESSPLVTSAADRVLIDVPKLRAGKCDERVSEILNLVEAMCKWQDQCSQVVTVTRAFKGFRDLEEALAVFNELPGDSMAHKLMEYSRHAKNHDAYPKLAAVQRAVGAMPQPSSDLGSTEAAKVFVNLSREVTARATDLVATAKQCVVDECTLALDAKIQALTQVALGGAAGAKWQEKMANKPTWPQYSSHAASTLLKAALPEIEGARDALAEDPLSTHDIALCSRVATCVVLASACVCCYAVCVSFAWIKCTCEFVCPVWSSALCAGRSYRSLETNVLCLVATRLQIA